MADINVTLTNQSAINATIQNAAVNSTVGSADVNVVVSNTPVLNATLTDTAGINITINGASATMSNRMNLTSGESLAARDIIYRSSDGKVYKAVNSSDEKEATGYVLTSVAADTSVLCYFGGGIISGFTGLTPNVRIFLSATPGSISTVTGSGVIVQQIGRTLSDTEIIFEPQTAIGQN